MLLTLTTNGETMQRFADGCVSFTCVRWFFFLYAEVCFLGKEQKRAHRTATKASGSAEEGPSKEVLREALEKVKSEKVPDSPEDREQYFMQNVSVGEQLCAQGMVLLPSMN